MTATALQPQGGEEEKSWVSGEAIGGAVKEFRVKVELVKDTENWGCAIARDPGPPHALYEKQAA